MEHSSFKTNDQLLTIVINVLLSSQFSNQILRTVINQSDKELRSVQNITCDNEYFEDFFLHLIISM